MEIHLQLPPLFGESQRQRLFVLPRRRSRQRWCVAASQGGGTRRLVLKASAGVSADLFAGYSSGVQPVNGLFLWGRPRRSMGLVTSAPYRLVT